VGDDGKLEKPPDAYCNSSSLISDIFQIRRDSRARVQHNRFVGETPDLLESLISADLPYQPNGYGAVSQRQEQRQDGRYEQRIASHPGLRVSCRTCQRPQGCCQGEAHPSKAGPDAQPYQLPFLTVLLNHYFQTRGSKQAAANLEIPTVKASSAMNHRALCL